MRAIESATLIVMILAVGAPHIWSPNVADRSLGWSLSQAWGAVCVYYLAFLYLPVSAVAFVVAEAAWGLGRLRVLVLANFLPFFVHSLAIIILLNDGYLGPLNGPWLATLFVNLIAPALLIRALQRL